MKSIGGGLLDVELEPSSLVAELKRKASGHWQVPAQCVKLVIGKTALHDDETCLSLCQGSSMELDVDMIICLDVLCQDLTDAHVNVGTKLETLKILNSLGQKGCPMAIDAVSTLLEHQKTNVRLAALETLQKLGHGDLHAIRCASALLAHRIEAVRQTGIRALGLLADKGDVNIVEAASVHLRQPNPAPVISAALQALAQVAEKGDVESIALVSVFMLDEEPAVRFQAINAVSRLAQRADMRAVAAVLECLDDEDWHVRCASVGALSVLAEPDQRILASVQSMLQDDNELVRDEAAKLLVKFGATEEPPS